MVAASPDERDTENLPHQGEEHYAPEVDQGLSPVAVEKSRNIALLVALVFGGAILIYYLFFSSEKPKEAATTTKAIQQELAAKAVKPQARGAEDPLHSVPSLPEPPPLVAPSPPPAPPAPVIPVTPPELPKPVLPAAPAPEHSAEVETPLGHKSPSLDARRHSPIMMGGGGGGGGKAGDKSATGKDDDKKKLSDAEQNQLDNMKPFTKLSATSSKQVRATKILDMSATIAQGKIIEAVLETAINSDLDGYVRAIVSRDVYAEAGKRVLIAKGSRLVGKYAAKIAVGQKRIAISWSRVIRPDGIDLALSDATAVDALGRAGIEGVVDTHYFELLYNAVMLSTANVIWSKGAEGLTNAGSAITTTSTDPTSGAKTVTSTGSATQSAVTGAGTNIGNTIQQIAGSGQAAPAPTITLDQGTAIKVYVNQDLIFPSSGSVSSIQVKVVP